MELPLYGQAVDDHCIMKHMTIYMYKNKKMRPMVREKGSIQAEPEKTQMLNYQLESLNYR